MDLATAGLQEQPFRSSGSPLNFVNYRAQRAAFEFFEQTCAYEEGLGFFYGPPLSGKSTLIRQYVSEITEARAAAVVDAATLDSAGLLRGMLNQFGYALELSSSNEMTNMLKVFIMQQAGSAKAPLLVIENAHAMGPGTLSDLCKLAAIKVRRKCALRIILCSDRSLAYMKEAPSVGAVVKRLTGEFNLGSLSRAETRDYLFEKLHAGGCAAPDDVIPRSVCSEIYSASQGWPGVIDQLVLKAFSSAEKLPLSIQQIERLVVTPAVRGGLIGAEPAGEDFVDDEPEIDPPLLFVTMNGETLKETTMGSDRFLIGRSQHNDLSIGSKHISRHHALLVRQGTVTVLMDLNSRNGTYVNSRRISNQVLMHDDIITIGHHGIKFSDPLAKTREALDGKSFTETVIMRNLEDMRRMLARETTRVLPEQQKASGDSDS